MNMRVAPKMSRMAAAIANTVASVEIDTTAVALRGGLDLVTPPLLKQPGTLVMAQNFEQATDGGYRRVGSYERFDGQTKPSEATFIVLTVTITTAPSTGQTLTGFTSGATGTVIAVTGTTIVLTQVSGTFQDNETVKVGVTVIGTTAASDAVGGASTAALHATYLNLAADVYRALIAAIPGEGRVRGCVLYNDVLYGFRNAVGGATAAIYKSTGSGWSAVTLYNEVSFTLGGATQPAEGATLTQGGVTATIKRVVQTNASTTWATNTAAGRFIITNPAGGNFAAGAATIGGINVTLSGVQTAITLLPSGEYEFHIYNMGGSINTKRIYGCDGVNRGFEFDGEVYVPITTGMTADAPTHVRGHLKQLFFSFGGSAQHAAPGTPYIWSVVLGAAELGIGDTITGFATQPGSGTQGTLAIFSRNLLSILYGTGVGNWNLVPYKEELGAYARTIQDIGKTVFLDDRGITDIRTSQEYGNFVHATLSDAIRPIANEYRIGACASMASRDLAQYRLFFTSGYGFYMTTVGKKVTGITTVLFPDVVRTTWSGEMNDGTEAMFFGSDDGYVYQMEKGTSFDGDSIEAFIELSFINCKSPRVLKSFIETMLELTSDSYASFSFGYTLGYGASEISQPSDATVIADFSAVQWDVFVWDEFTWDGITLAPAALGMEGDAENVSLAIRSTSDEYAPFTITAAIINHIARRQMVGAAQ